MAPLHAQFNADARYSTFNVVQAGDQHNVHNTTITREHSCTFPCFSTRPFPSFFQLPIHWTPYHMPKAPLGILSSCACRTHGESCLTISRLGYIPQTTV